MEEFQNLHETIINIEDWLADIKRASTNPATGNVENADDQLEIWFFEAVIRDLRSCYDKLQARFGQAMG